MQARWWLKGSPEELLSMIPNKYNDVFDTIQPWQRAPYLSCVDEQVDI